MTDADDSEPFLPPRPRAVLRVGFAGRRELDGAEQDNLARALDRVLGRIGTRLAALTPGAAVAAEGVPSVAAFYDRSQPPLLRLVTGLCEGADTSAALALERLRVPPDGASPQAVGAACIDTELAAVLPFDLARYRASRHGWFQAEFDRQAAACAYIVELDGLHDRPQPEPEPDSPRDRLARRRRARGYRAQSKVLLRQIDLLIAAADPDAEGQQQLALLICVEPHAIRHSHIISPRTGYGPTRWPNQKAAAATDDRAVIDVINPPHS